MTAPHPVTSRSCKGPRLGRSRAREAAQGMLGKDPASRIPAGMRCWNASGCCWRVPGAPCHPPRTQTKLRPRAVPMSCTGAGTQSHKRLHPPIPPRREGQLLTSGSQPTPLSAGGPGEGGTRGRSLGGRGGRSRCARSLGRVPFIRRGSKRCEDPAGEQPGPRGTGVRARRGTPDSQGCRSCH